MRPKAAPRLALSLLLPMTLAACGGTYVSQTSGYNDQQNRGPQIIAPGSNAGFLDTLLGHGKA